MPLLVALGQAKAATGPVAAAASTSETGALSGRVDELASRVDKVSSELNETQTLEKYVLAPIAILVAILAAGGVLGVVYSVRDQRRISQLHELTVSGEVSSQRRSEQSYGSFLEQSQTTLALVNDTLKLAKESTDRAAHSMDIKAQTRVDAIEESAQQLMLEVFSAGEFESIIDDHARRGRLHKIADELRSLEGYLSLQDIKLRQYTRFVKAIDQFLLDDTESALLALRLAAQERAIGDLHRFTEYWLGYMLTTVGEYGEAMSMLRDDEEGLKDDHSQYFQLERIIAETEFFLLAKTRSETDSSNKSVHDGAGPAQRFELVAPVLSRLAKLAKRIGESDDQRGKRHTVLEIARTRADIYEWVAYHPRHLDEPLDFEAVERLRRDTSGGAGTPFVTDTLSEARRWSTDPNALRAWALTQARTICLEHEERNFDVDFALAECHFKLGDPEADRAFERAEHALHHELGEFREKRQNASLQQSMLVCHSRLLKLRESDDQQRRTEARQVLQAAGDARDAVREMRQARVTIFSQIQRRNVTQDEFKEEIGAIVDQDHIKPDDT